MPIVHHCTAVTLLSPSQRPVASMLRRYVTAGQLPIWQSLATSRLVRRSHVVIYWIRAGHFFFFFRRRLGMFWKYIGPSKQFCFCHKMKNLIQFYTTFLFTQTESWLILQDCRVCWRGLLPKLFVLVGPKDRCGLVCPSSWEPLVPIQWSGQAGLQFRRATIVHTTTRLLVAQATRPLSPCLAHTDYAFCVPRDAVHFFFFKFIAHFQAFVKSWLQFFSQWIALCFKLWYKEWIRHKVFRISPPVLPKLCLKLSAFCSLWCRLALIFHRSLPAFLKGPF